MAEFCRECGSKLVNGKCVRPGCVNYAGQPEESRSIKMEPARSDGPSMKDIYPVRNDNPIEDTRTPGYEDPVEDTKTPGYEDPVEDTKTPGYEDSVEDTKTPGYEDPVEDTKTPGYEDFGDDPGAPGYDDPGVGEDQKSGLTTDDIQKRLSGAGKKADEAIKGGFDRLSQSFERQRAKERAITEGTGRGFTGTGDRTITGIKLVKDEKMVRTYHCTTYGYFKKKEGYMTVTNKRVIFESMDETSRISNEISIDGVTGFKNYYGMNISPALSACAVVLVVFAIWIYQTSLRMPYGNGAFALYALMLFVMAAVCGFLAVRRSVVVNVFSSKATGTPISVGEGPRSMIGNGSVYTMVGRPTEDTGTMIREIGAMVQDLQTRGDHAIKDWVIDDSANPIKNEPN